MSYCAEHGIPHSRFIGGPDVWSETDRAKVIAWTLERAERCPSCGTAPWEWQADRGAYVATTELCLGCMNREALAEDTAEHKAKGTRVILMPRKQAEFIAANPAAFTVDSPSARMRRRASRGT